jgi:hypothetical protein
MRSSVTSRIAGAMSCVALSKTVVVSEPAATAGKAFDT